MEAQPICKTCGEYVECEEITGLWCSACWLQREEEKEIAFKGLQSTERNMNL